MNASVFLDFVRLVVDGDAIGVSRRLKACPALAAMASPAGASRQEAGHYFFTEIRHYMYAGDTALHIAAAAFCRPVAEPLVAYGADCRAAGGCHQAPGRTGCTADRYGCARQAGP